MKASFLSRRNAPVRYPLLLAVSALLLVGCGEYFAVPEENPDEPLTMTLSAHDVTLMTGDMYQLRAIFNDDSIPASSIFWHTDDSKVAQVESGLIMARDAGSTLITAMYSDNPELIDYCQVHVYKKELVTVVLNRQHVALPVSDTYQLTATVTVVGSDTAYPDFDCLWTSSDESVVKVDDGRLTPVGIGTAIVSASANGGEQVAECEITVIDDWASFVMHRLRYETVVYARLMVDGKDITTNKNTSVAAFIDDDFRRMGVVRTERGITYFTFRVGSDHPSGEAITFQGYDNVRKCLITIPETVPFQENATVGTLSNLFVLNGTRIE